MTQMPSLLVCEIHESARQRLLNRFRSAGFHVRVCDSAQHALQMLEHHRFDAVLCGLMLRDQDAVSFAHELRILGFRMPTVISAFQTAISLERDEDLEPDWVRKAAEQARLIFTLKTACRTSRRFHPRILHVEPDPFCSSLVQAAMGADAEIVSCDHDDAIDAALANGGHDLVILDPVDADRERLEQRFHRLALSLPDTPLLLHARYLLHDPARVLPEACDLGMHGLDLVEVVNTLILHGREAPLCAQA